MSDNRKKIMLLNQLKGRISDYDRLIKYYKVYNFKNALIRRTINFGFYVDCFIPITLSFYGMFMLLPNGHKPFILDDKVVYAYEKVIDNSLGEHMVGYNFDFPYEDSLDYFTSWNFNEDNQMFERNVITYSINDFNFDYDDVFDMNQEELSNIFDIYEITTFCDSELSDEDYKFNSDFVQITRGRVSDSISKNSKQSMKVNCFETFLYCLSSFSLSFILYFMQKYLFRNFSYKELKSRFKTIDEDEISVIKKIKKIEKENLDLLYGNNNSSIKVKIKKRGD